MKCSACDAEVLEIDVKCPKCGIALGASGAQRMIGSVMLGQYELVDVLGQGGMSVVFKGRHKLTEQEVALKILPPELAAHSQVKSRFLDEAKALATLDHPNIVHLYNFGEENGFFVLAMQFVQGRTWERIILESKKLDWKASCRITIDVLRALEYAHGRGVVHRDMKPSNVLVRAHDASATVMDFGIAKMTTSTRLTATGQTMGTVRYMSPEQVRGQEVDLRTDIYSLGATLFESLTGDTPFDGQTHFEIMTKHLSEVPKRPSSLGIEVPALVEDALMRSLSKRPDDRFGEAREMRKILEASLRDSDLGLVETQRISREVLGAVRPVAKPVATPKGFSSAPTATLADELEPGHTGAVPKRGFAPWLAVLVIVLVGGASAAALLLRGESGYTPVIKDIKGVRPVSGGTFGTVLIESSGKVTPADMAKLYEEALVKLREFAAKNHLDVADPLQQIVSVPQDAFCDQATYLGSKPPDDCRTRGAIAVISPNNKHRLLVVDDPVRLPTAFVQGVADATCDFYPDPEDRPRLQAFCEMTKKFIAESGGSGE